MVSIPEVALFFLIGAVVSLDVAGLTAVKLQTYTGTARQIYIWAAQNAFWHAILLLVYGSLTIAIADWALPNIFRDLVDWLRDIDAPLLIRNIVAEIGNHVFVGFAIVTITLVWRAYVGKVVENPFEVPTEKEGPQRRFVRWLLTGLGLNRDALGRQLQSMAVAMDMLALAFLMRSLEMFGAPSHVESFARVASISTIIFASVFGVTVTTAWVFRRQFSKLVTDARQTPDDEMTLAQVIFVIRLVEPLLIFYFLCEMISYTVWRHISSSSVLFIGAALLVFALTKAAGLKNIWAVSQQMVKSLRELPQ